MNKMYKAPDPWVYKGNMFACQAKEIELEPIGIGHWKWRIKEFPRDVEFNEEQSVPAMHEPVDIYFTFEGYRYALNDTYILHNPKEEGFYGYTYNLTRRFKVGYDTP